MRVEERKERKWEGKAGLPRYSFNGYLEFVFLSTEKKNDEKQRL